MECHGPRMRATQFGRAARFRQEETGLARCRMRPGCIAAARIRRSCPPHRSGLGPPILRMRSSFADCARNRSIVIPHADKSARRRGRPCCAFGIVARPSAPFRNVARHRDPAGVGQRVSHLRSFVSLPHSAPRRCLRARRRSVDPATNPPPEKPCREACRAAAGIRNPNGKRCESVARAERNAASLPGMCPASGAAGRQTVDDLAERAEQQDRAGQQLDQETRAAPGRIGHVAEGIEQPPDDPDNAHAGRD